MADIKVIDYEKSSGTFTIQLADSKELKIYNVNEISGGSPLLDWVMHLEPSDEVIVKNEYGISFKLLDKNINIVYKDNTPKETYRDLDEPGFNNISHKNIDKDCINYLFLYFKKGKKVDDDISTKLLLSKNKVVGGYSEPEYYEVISFFSHSFNKYFVKQWHFDISQYMICVIPGHQESLTNCSNTTDIANFFIRANNSEDGTQALLRCKTIPPKHRTEGQRLIEVDLNSLKVNPSIDVRGKKILLLDDITTSGNSLDAGKRLLSMAGAREVICFAFGKNVR